MDKRPGLAVHPHDGAEYGRTLIDHIQAYLYAKREWRPREENSFTPALCNRIDRNTGGIVIAAKNAETLRILNQKIRDRELEKRYLCIVRGTLRPAAGTLEGYLFKDAVQNRVYITKSPQPGSKTAVTRYRTLQVGDGISLVECELVTPDASDPGRRWPPRATRFWATANTAAWTAAGHGHTRPCTPTGCASIFPQTPAFSHIWTAGASRWTT